MSTDEGRRGPGARDEPWVTFADCFTEIDWARAVLAELDAAAARSRAERHPVRAERDAEPIHVPRS